MVTESIQDGKAVLFHYVLRDDAGEIVDASQQGPMAYLHGHGNIVPGLENALVGKTMGDAFNVTIEPADGYGDYNPEAVMKVHRSQMPKDMEIEPGMALHAQTPDGSPMVVWVVEHQGAYVTLTSNHPMAGKRLHFEIQVVGVRNATSEELAHGHVHGPGGHHNH